MIPPFGGSKSLPGNDLEQSHLPACTLACTNMQESGDSELASVLQAWPTLSHQMRVAILAMVNAARATTPASEVPGEGQIGKLN